MIKFRGIPLEDVSSIDGVNFDGEFVYGNYVKNGDGALIIGDVLEAEEDMFWPYWWVPVDPKTVGQFTGLTDVNGKDIYEGDILENRKYRSIVKFASGKFLADLIETIQTFDLIGETHGSKVIGNVHENPELLKG
ncbi:YopX family protein [Lactiplantibacillus plantarum]|uniref:YopX family protein n=1 Tax=Lactiplantibacillus plantarum TaxID=1590 RepID=UPI001F4D0E21|nr:YopX family protein [Lactiplantibacillus plantarum]MCH8625962.1 YopX family protein [Lactiplantibacillus plantarum]MCH8632326.1 YopX family protein [Lactiplantibacillus plantarum]MCH8635397.1 YopX family protein [Lactiplantibacillus plantarum]